MSVYPVTNDEWGKAVAGKFHNTQHDDIDEAIYTLLNSPIGVRIKIPLTREASKMRQEFNRKARKRGLSTAVYPAVDAGWLYIRLRDKELQSNPPRKGVIPSNTENQHGAAFQPNTAP